MRILEVTNTGIDLTSQKVPFIPSYTVVVENPVDTGTLVLQESDDNSTWSTLASVAASKRSMATLNKRYIRCSTAASMYLWGN